MNDFTDNFNLNLPDFNEVGWHDPVNENFTAIDALLFAITGITTRGEWQNDTSYLLNEIALDVNNATLYKCLVPHTSAATGTFAADRAANPTYWAEITSIALDEAVAAAQAAQAAAETAETNAELAETNAETAETNAETAATNAASSASAAATSASNAATSETNAETAETNAETAETNAAASASSASTSATNASNSASAAATSATNAANSATAAQTAETNAETAETNAESAETAAEAAQVAAEAAQAAAEAIAATIGSLDSLTDVNTSGAGVNDVLTFNGATWEPGAGGGGGGVLSIEDYGAVADAVVITDAAITSTDQTLTSASNPFASGDVGKRIVVGGAGASGVPLETTIATFTNSGSVELTDAAGTTVSGETAVFGTDNTTDIQAALDGESTLSIGPGSYLTGPVSINTPVQLILDPLAVIMRGFADNSSHDPLFHFISGSDNSSITGGTFNGLRDIWSSKYDDINVQWPSVMVQSADRLSVQHVSFLNETNWAIWVGSGDEHFLSDLRVTDSGKAFLVQFTDRTVTRDIVAENISNNGIAMYQHAFEFRVMDGGIIENIRVNGYTPTIEGSDPWPIAFAVERVDGCKVSGLFLQGFDGEEPRNYGAQISNARDTSFSDLHFENCFWGINFQSAFNCTLTGFSTYGGFKTDASQDGFGLGFGSHGVFQSDPSQVTLDLRGNAQSKFVTASNGTVHGHEVGVICYGSNLKLTNIMANANRFYGFSIREAADNASVFPGQIPPRVENVGLVNCQARFNGASGVLIESGDQIEINGGAFCDNGWDTGQTATLRAGILLAEFFGADDVGRVSISNVFVSDTQDWTKTDGGSFEPGSTDADDQFEIALVDPSRVGIGQYINLVNADGAGDIVGRIVDLNLDTIIVDCGGAETFSETGNLTSLTGTISSSGNTITGSSTAFATEIIGSAWIKSDGSFYRVQNVNTNTQCHVTPAPSPALSGDTAEILEIDVEGIPSQQYGLVVGSTVTGPVRLNNISSIGNVVAPYNIGNSTTVNYQTSRIGVRFIHSKSTPPPGALKANGAAVLIATYSELASEIYCGDGNNATAEWGYKATTNVSPSSNRSTSGTYIVLPDDRGEFMRGWDDSRGVDSGRSLWAAQGDLIENHVHEMSAGGNTNTTTGGSGNRLASLPGAFDTGDTSNPTTNGGAETRPRNQTGLACIWYA